MRRFFLLASVVALLSACVASPEEIEAYKQRYVFDDLPTVGSISNFRLDSWNAIDEYALVVNLRGGDTYLLILNTFLPEVNRSIELLVTSSDGEVRSGFDTVRTRRQPYMRSSIQTIYRITEDQIPDIEARIMNPDDQPARVMSRVAEVPDMPASDSMPAQSVPATPPSPPAEPMPVDEPVAMEDESEQAEEEEDDSPGFFERIRERLDDFGSQPDEPMRPRR